MMPSFKTLLIKVNTNKDIDKSHDDALAEIARGIAEETAYAATKTDTDKRFTYNCGYFKLQGVDQRVYYVCAFEHKTEQIEVWFSHSDRLYQKAKADYDKSEGKINPATLGLSVATIGKVLN